MNIRPLAPELSISDQLQPRDVLALAKAGVASIVCNRPDGETPDQPGHDLIRAAAHDVGIAFAYLPITAGPDCVYDHEGFARLRSELPGPVLAYCRTGTRSASLWALAEASAGRGTPDTLIALAALAGCDLNGIRECLLAAQ
ncbi:TIGR01244 family sulfur transferase [Stenotrophomonas maltophilia]|uniref:TIGR01244 family protein n=1 Tax=Stenotrophomonas maltophilia TaxID=40324 RepID=A0A246IDD1_STEMA|nr:TIGR01244 family sulfur transferase [Stenotrophomonas maltophilia]OWQ78031.1 TIGR01244 family protein [Stenotrophomonas maltophilia]